MWHFMQIVSIFLIFSQKTGFDIPCKLSAMETICMVFQILFFWEKIKKKINISSAENATQYIKHWNNYLSVSKLLIYNTNIFVCLFF